MHLNESIYSSNLTLIITFKKYPKYLEIIQNK